MAPRSSDAFGEAAPFTPSQRVFISPAMAAELLERNTHNRPVNEAYVEQYAHDMAFGLWVETPLPIIFEKGGFLQDGQHRLLAIIKSGCGQWFHVVWDAPAKVQGVIDQGIIRRPAQQITLSHGIGSVTNQEVAIARIMFASSQSAPVAGVPAKTKMSTQAISAMISRHRDAISFSIGVHGASKGLTACVRAVVARAWYTQDRGLLTSFCQCVATGVSPRGKEDSAAAILSKWVSRQHSLGSSAIRNSLYRKTERALDAYISGVEIERLCDSDVELYPIPGEPAWDKVKAVA